MQHVCLFTKCLGAAWIPSHCVHSGLQQLGMCYSDQWDVLGAVLWIAQITVSRNGHEDQQEELWRVRGCSMIFGRGEALCWWLGEFRLFWNAEPEQLFSQTASWNNRKKESKHAVSPLFSSWFALQEGVRQWGNWFSFKVENICVGQVTFTAVYFRDTLFWK